MVKEGLIFVGGITVGVLIGMKLAERKYNERFEDAVNDRIDAIHAEEEAKRKEKKAEETRIDDKAKRDYNKIVHEYNASKVPDDIVKKIEETNEEETAPEQKKDVHKDEDDEEDEDEDDEDGGEEAESGYHEPRPNPYLISYDEYEDNESFEKHDLYYYDGNYTLVDDTDSVVDQEDADILLGFGWSKDFQDGAVKALYIRNEKVCADYEVLWNPGPYLA